MIRKFSSLFLLSFRRQGSAKREQAFTARVSCEKDIFPIYRSEN